MTPKVSRPLLLALSGGALVGVLTVLQSHTNGSLGRSLGDGYVGAALSFLIGSLLVVIGMVFSRSARSGVRVILTEARSGRLPWWALTGGLGGAAFVLSQGVAVGLIGVALFTVGSIAGQILGGLLLDRAGVGPSGKIMLTVPRVLGTVLAIAAVLLSVMGDLGGVGRSVLLVVVPLLSGALIAWQVAVNGLAQAAGRSALAAAFVNFAVGSVVICLAAGISIAVNGWPTVWPSDPWVYLGGPASVAIVALLAVLVRHAGVLVLSMANVAGQLIAALVFEAWMPLTGGATPWMIAGSAVALLAVAVAALPGRRGGADPGAGSKRQAAAVR